MFSFYSRRNLVNFSSIMLCCLPLTLHTGPFLSDLSVVLIGLIFISISIKEKLWHYYKNNFFIFFLFFYFFILISSIASESPLLSLESSLLYFRFGIFVLATWFLIDNNKNIIKFFTICLLLTFIISIFDGFIQFFFKQNIFGFMSISPNRMTLLFNDNMVLGGYLSRLFPMLLGLLIYHKTNTSFLLILTFLLIVFTDSLIFITGERTALALLILSITLFIILLNNFKLLRLFSLVVSIIIIMFIMDFNPDIKRRNIDNTLAEMNMGSDYDNIIIFSKNHESIYKTSYNIFLDNKLIGAGPKLFREHCSDVRYKSGDNACSTHPHSTYIQLLAETGLVGTLFIVTMLILISFKFLKHLILKFFYKKEYLSDYRLSLMICFFISLWPIAPSLNFFNNWISIIYFLPIGFYLYDTSKKNIHYEKN